ncbi:hypothetical protein KP509_26G023000 [Ceratopteris richardii]|uniref:Uncharacterized protein n=1 Tax=Ceratopteris richardii TaxID=49495 RepID=A0A8T2RLP2_CERRI|nr:hypothetical protein KP509_26G023000 [Ceratopteris richardii]
MASVKISSTGCYIAPLVASQSRLQSYSTAKLQPVPFCSQDLSSHRQTLSSEGPQCNASFVQARLGRTGGAGVLERPGLDQSQVGNEPSVQEGGEMGKLSQKRILGGGDRYRVLLLDHEKHTEDRVTSVLPKVVPSITADEARQCFRASRETGVGIVTVTVKTGTCRILCTNDGTIWFAIWN